MQHVQFGSMQGSVRRLTGGYTIVKVLHELGSRSIADIPQRADDIARTGTEKRPSEPHQALPGICAHAGALACGDGHQIRAQGPAQNVTRVELCGVWRCALCGEDDRRIERDQLAGHSVGDEMDIVEAAGLASNVCGG